MMPLIGEIDTAITQIQLGLGYSCLCGGNFSFGSLNGVFDGGFEIGEIGLPGIDCCLG